MMKYNLKVDEEFRRMIPPSSLNEREQLEANIAKNGCFEPLCVWNHTILDGHKRYEICTRLGLRFSIAYIFLKNRDAAAAWICANQLERQNLSVEAKRYLIGKRYAVEKNVGAHNMTGRSKFGGGADGAIGLTRERIAKEYNVSGYTVARHGHYAQAIDTLSEIEPELPAKILSGETKLACEDVIALSQLQSPEIRRIAARLSDDPQSAICEIDAQRIIKPKKRRAKGIRPPNSAAALKETPAYDPDASVTSLFFTIPSWIGAIERTAMEVDYAAVSSQARHQLSHALRDLIGAAQIIEDRIKEAPHEQ